MPSPSNCHLGRTWATLRAGTRLGLLTTALICTTAAGVRAQSPGMPLFLVEGNHYERRTVDERGRLEKYEELEIGRLVRNGDEFEAAVTVRGFDEAGQATGAVQTTIRCRVEDANMVMTVLALLEPEGRRVRVRVTGEAILYPPPPAQGALPPVTLEADVEDGVLGFLGSRSRIVLRDRMAQPVPDLGVAYTVDERLDLAFYVLGVRVRSRTYRAEETIAQGRGLVRQVLTGPDGSSVSLDLVTEPAPSVPTP